MKKVVAVTFLLIMASAVFAQTDAKTALAIIDIRGNAVSEDDANAITELFIAEMVSTGSVKIVDRSNFEKIMGEMNFQTTD